VTIAEVRVDPNATRSGSSVEGEAASASASLLPFGRRWPERPDEGSRRKARLSCEPTERGRTHPDPLPQAGCRIHTSQFEIVLVRYARSVLGVDSPSKDGRPFGRPLAAPASRVAPPGSSPRVASPDASARLRLSVFMVFAAGSRPCGPASLSKDHGCASPHRRGAVTAKRAKRSGAAAKRLDGDGPMGPPTGDVCIRWPQAVRGKWRVAGSTAMRPALAVQISRSAPGGIAALRAGFDPTRTSVAGD
jgi:hypothetical protein